MTTQAAINRPSFSLFLNLIEDLSDDQGNEAYLRAKEGEKYLVYLPKGGKVSLHLKNEDKKYLLQFMKRVAIIAFIIGFFAESSFATVNSS